MNQFWSWALAAVGIAGLWIAASRPRIGFAVSIAAQALWVAYALTTRQYGFLVTAAAYTVVYVRLWRRARQPRPDRSAT